ncbi:N,N-dimethylformamidase beta subunit family domain-containing protein [Streptomyces sp. NPDC048057]|uniref:N,N-dimethylformamidase beta subunit family domain-containing protein n=1 Tax=Streptomyces sp. NPDC048057 TaxID=3155628 RepID=UPI0033DDFAE0
MNADVPAGGRGDVAQERAGLDRRRFLGAAGAAGIAAATAACDTPGDGPTGTARPTTAPPSAEAAERGLAGNADWRLRSTGPPDAVEGYPDQISVLPGERFGLHVSTTAPGFTVSACRIGWYGGAGARLDWRSPRTAGRRQPPGRLTDATRTVRADWARTTDVATEGWPPGAYLLRLDAENGRQRYVPLVVRSPSAAGRTVVMHAVATWQAYNTWGGHDLDRGEDGAPGNVRTVVCYKTAHRDDPHLATHPALPTNDFRQPPAADPESPPTGVLYEGYPTDAPYVVHAADHWLFAGTGVRAGDRFDHLVGVEYDRVTPGMPTPRPLEIISHSPLVCNGRTSHADSASYTTASGAGVFATGTMRWVEALMAGTLENGRNHGMDSRTGAFVTRTTENLLRVFAEGPAATHRPQPRDNVTAVYAT